MKRIAAILLMGLLLFNWYGYQLFYFYLQERSDLQMEAFLDLDLYNNDDLFTLKIPLHLPYMVNQTDFQRIEGEVNLEGITYTYVKRKVANDTLYLHCLLNKDKMKLTLARNEYFKSVADLQHSGKSTNNHSIVKSPISDFLSGTNSWCILPLAVYEKLFSLFKVNNYSSPMKQGADKPPKAYTLCA